MKNKYRLFSIILIIFAFTITVFYRFIYLSFLNTENNSNPIKRNNIISLRGNIFDKNKRLLATNKLNYSVFANPQEFDENEIKTKLNTLAKLLNIPENTLIEKFNLNKRFNWIKRKIPKNTSLQIKKLNMKGIYLKEEYKRQYPHNKLLSHVLGFTNIDNTGIEGIEYSFNQTLKAKQYENSSKLNIAYGDNVYLNIDYKFQKIIEDIIKESIEKYQAETASAIILNSSNGKILALANYPKYNNNKFSNYPQKLFRNIAITNYYEPGSIFKVFTAAMLIEEKLVKENDLFFCPGSITINKRTIKCNKQHNYIQFSDVIKKSCNVGIIKSSFLISKKKFYNYLKKFGFGEKTQIQLAGENQGLLRPINEINSLSKAMLSFGYEIGVTPIQLVTAASAVATGGILYKPLIVNKITDNKEYPKEIFNKIKIRQTISKETSNRIYKILQSVIQEGGTGYKASINKLLIAGKTSTTNVYDKQLKAFDKNKVNTSFIGFIPYNNKLITIGVFIQKPKKGMKIAAYVAAPTFKKIVETILNKGLIVY